MVAVLAHALSVIGRDVFGKDMDPDRAASAALFHDCAEIMTGDMPTPVKYYNAEIRTAYQQVEDTALERLLRTLPADIQPEYDQLLHFEQDQKLYRIVKAADTLSAYIKCEEERKTGNREFDRAAAQTREKLENLHMPEVDYFLEHFMPSFQMTLDELNMGEN